MEEHKKAIEFKIGVITVSTSRFKKYGRVRGIKNIPNDDESGRLLLENLPNVCEYLLVPDSIEEIRRAVYEILDDVDALVLTGGTGISPKDVTIEAIEPIVDKKIDGFGEIFRTLSYNEIGVDAILSRAFAGVMAQKIVFCLPGSKKAVKLGTEIIKKTIVHLISHAKGLA
ncbi:MAG: MogA/MoaB family molybdenum cofactor biosynthesis protein [Archaeoglobales archaeon]|nr:MogA/MoaB family molybdenum cofactor biosynthesis protein [Archaeoglobales archaeon]